MTPEKKEKEGGGHMGIEKSEESKKRTMLDGEPQIRTKRGTLVNAPGEWLGGWRGEGRGRGESKTTRIPPPPMGTTSETEP